MDLKLPLTECLLEVLGTPYPWRTPRWSPHGHTYKHKELARWQRKVREVALAVGHPPTDQPVELVMVFMFDRPASHLKKCGGLRKGKSWAPISRRCGDLTNLFKGVEDALSGILFVDDCQVVSSHSQAKYAGEGEQAGCWVNLKILREDPDGSENQCPALGDRN